MWWFLVGGPVWILMGVDNYVVFLVKVLGALSGSVRF